MTGRLPMTRGRVLALVVGVPLALITIAWTALTAVAYAGQGSYPVRLNLPLSSGTAGVSVGSGNMTVGPALDGRLRLAGTAHYSLIRSSLSWQRTRSGVNVVSFCQLPVGVCSVNLTVSVPTSARAVLSDGSGDLTVRHLTGYVSAGSGSGNVVATGLSGPRVMLSDSSGNINVSGLASPHLVASDGSGDVTLTFTRVPSHVSVADDSGNVTLILPRGPALYRVDASTSSGNRVVGVRTSSVSQHVIKVTDGSGNISITY
jgi:hypothetical protein